MQDVHWSTTLDSMHYSIQGVGRLWPDKFVKIMCAFNKSRVRKNLNM